MWPDWASEMPFRLVFPESYNRRAARWLKRHPDLRGTYLKTLQLLEANPHHPSLRLHALSGKLDGLHAISQGHVLDVELFRVGAGHHAASFSISAAQRSAVTRAAEVMMSRLPA